MLMPMQNKKKKAFLLVTHSEEVKSSFLKELAEGNKYKKSVKINQVKIFLRRETKYTQEKFFDSIAETENDFLITTFSPDFNGGSDRAKYALTILKRKYSLFFFILKQERRFLKMITDAEVSVLKSYGQIQISNSHSAAEQAIEFKKFIEKSLPTKANQKMLIKAGEGSF
jgi:hypothetical protein